MKNKIRFAITALALVLFAACFFVACSDDVVSGKNNDHSYAEVLESNGAFVYKDKNYETLQDAIDAFAKDDSVARVTVGDQNKITVIGNAKTRGITIPEDSILYIDLNGFEVQFFDVDASAIKVGAGSTFVVNGGSFSLFEKSEELSVISIVGKADRGSSLVLSNLTIKADGQTAIFQDEYTSSVLSDSVVVNGATIARGGKENTSLTSFCDLPDVRMRGAQLVVGGSAVAVVTENSGENEYIVSPTATIVDKTGTIGPIEKGVCYIIRAGETFTFGSLREAIESLTDKGETIVLIADEEVAPGEPIALSKSVTIDLNGYSVGTNNIVLADGVDLTIYGVAKNAVETAIPSFTGTITSDPAGSSSLKLYLVEMNSAIDVSRTVSANNSVFHGNISAGFGVYLTESEVKGVGEKTVDITSAFGDIVLADVTGEIGDLTASSFGGDVIINNAEATGSLTTGKIKAVSHVTLTGSSVSTNEDASLAIGGTVELSGKLTSREVLFKAAVSAGSVEDVGSTFCDDIAAKGALSFTDSYFDNVEAIESIAGGNIVIEKSYGSVDRVETKAPEADAKATASGSITIDTSDNEQYSLTVGDVWATYYVAESEIYYGDITLKGNAETGYLTVIGSVIGKDINAENVTFDSDNQQDRSIFGNSVDLKTSRFVSGWGTEVPASNFYSIEAIEDIDFTTVEGTTGALTAKNVTVKNSEAFGKLTTGAIEATAAVSLKGKLIVDPEDPTVSFNSVEVDGTVAGASLDSSFATIDGAVTLSGKLTSADSVFIAAVSAASVEDNRGDFYADITATTGNVMLTGSTFGSTTTSYPAVTSEAGSILMTGVSGTTGALTASGTGNDVTINNKDSGLITTGSITADDAVSLTGRTGNVVTAGAVHAVSLNASYAAVTGIVSLSGDLTSANSVFESVITAATVVDAGSTFKSAISTKANGGGAKFTGSVFASTEEQPVAVLSLSGNIEMTGVTGISGNLRSALGSVTIDNAQNTAAFETGAIKAAEAVSITGNSSANVVVGYVVEGADAGLSVKASILNTDYAVVNGTVVLTGNMTSQRSVFKDTIKADAITDTGSAFEKAIVATDDVVLTGSTFSNSAPVKSDGNITMTTVRGQAGMLEASNVTVSNYAAVANLETGAIVAVNAVVAGHAEGTYKVTVGGVKGATLDVSRSTVAGAVTLTGGMTSEFSVFGDDVSASTVSDNGSTFNDVVFTNVGGGDAVFDSSKFASENAAVTSSSGNIIMTGVTGTAGDLKSSLGCVTIDNSEATAPLSTGSVEAAEAVSIKGKSSVINVVARLNVKASTLDTVYATVNGTVTLSGDMTSAHSVFKGDVSLDGNLKSSGSSFAAVSANAVIDSMSRFAGDISAVDDVSLTGSVFESNAGIESTAGNILLTEVTGNAGNLSAPADGKNVTIDNAKALAALETGKITAGNAVAVTGSLIYQNSPNSTKVNSVTVVGVYGKTLDSSYANLDGAVELSGNLKSGYSVFAGTCAVSAFTVVDSNSTVKGDITAEEDATFENTVFHTSADIRSTNGNILMTKTTGESGTITASTYGKNVTIDNAKAIGEFKTAKITAGNAVTVTGNSDHKVTVAGVAGSTLDAVFAIFNGAIEGAIEVKNDVTLTNSEFADGASITSLYGNIELTTVSGTAGALTAYSVTIDDAEAGGELETGIITASDAVSVTGNSYFDLIIGGVSKASNLDVVYTTVDNTVSITGDLTSTDSTFNGSVTAATITDTRGTFSGSSTDVITAKLGDVTLTDSKISVTAVTSVTGKIVMTNVANVTTTAAGKLTASSVKIDNSQATAALKTGAIEATGAVTVTGNSSKKVTVAGVLNASTLDVTYATVTDYVTISGDLTSIDTTFSGTVSAATITDTRGTFNGANTDSITATTGDVTLTGSTFGSNKVGVNAAFGSIRMTKVSGTAGALNACNVEIDNTLVQVTKTLTTGVISATEAVTVTGRNSASSVTVEAVEGSSVKAAALDISYATVNGAVTLSGKLTSSNSAFSGAVTAASVEDERSAFGALITATTGDVTLTGSKLNSTAAGVTSVKGNIVMTNVTKGSNDSAGNLTAYSVTINNAEATEALVTGSITADGAVSVTGNSYKTVTVGAVTGSTLDVAYATVTDAVTITGDLTSANSAFSGTVTAASVEDERSAFGALITAKTGDVTLTGSKLNSTAAGVTSTEGSILMTKVTGTAGALEAYSVTINNDQTSAALKTGVIKSVGAVKVTGNSKYPVTVGGVTGTKLDADYVSVSGETILYGDLTSSNSTFVGRVSAATIEDTRSEFSGDVYGVGDVKLTGSRFNFDVADVLSWTGDIVMTGVFGSAGSLTTYGDAKTITIDNSKSFAPLTTGAVRSASAVPGAVTVRGNAYYGAGKVTVGAISGTTVDVAYATVSGAITASGDVTLTDSVFDTEDGVTSTADSILMTNVTGQVGNLTASATGMDITINNAEAKASLTTGAITADDTVTVTGNAYRQVTVDGSITGTTLVANYANLMGSINTKTSVTASNCTVGDGTTDDDVTSTTVSITGSRMKLDRLAADSVTITSPVLYATTTPSSVSSIVAKDLSVTAENDKFSVGTVAASRMISIAGGTFTGAFTFSGSTASTITAGEFTGTFRHTGTAALSITGGLFTGTGSVQRLESGTTTIDGTYSSTYGWDVVFDNLFITGGTAIIKSGYFEATYAGQLNNIGEHVSQDSNDTASKFVNIAYKGQWIGDSDTNSLRLASEDKLKKVVIDFVGDGNESRPTVARNLKFYYPNSSAVVLNGAIVLIGNTYHVESYNNRSIYGIVSKDYRTGSRAAEIGSGDANYYYYD